MSQRSRSGAWIARRVPHLPDGRRRCLLVAGVCLRTTRVTALRQAPCGSRDRHRGRGGSARSRGPLARRSRRRCARPQAVGRRPPGGPARRRPRAGPPHPTAGGIPAWPECERVFLETAGRRLPVVVEALTRPPQTNEIGRAGVLIGGLLEIERIAERPVRLRGSARAQVSTCSSICSTTTSAPPNGAIRTVRSMWSSSGGARLPTCAGRSGSRAGQAATSPRSMSTPPAMRSG